MGQNWTEQRQELIAFLASTKLPTAKFFVHVEGRLCTLTRAQIFGIMQEYIRLRSWASRLPSPTMHPMTYYRHKKRLQQGQEQESHHLKNLAVMLHLMKLGYLRVPDLAIELELPHSTAYFYFSQLTSALFGELASREANPAALRK